jgi:hypothetical protein
VKHCICWLAPVALVAIGSAAVKKPTSPSQLTIHTLPLDQWRVGSDPIVMIGCSPGRSVTRVVGRSVTIGPIEVESIRALP